MVSGGEGARRDARWRVVGLDNSWTAGLRMIRRFAPATPWHEVVRGLAAALRETA